MHAEHDVDLAVIGSGGAAMAAGITAREAGASVVLVERGPLGGTCLNVGCVPSKALLAAAGRRHSALVNPFAGIATSAGRVDLQSLVAEKADLIRHLQQHKYADVAEAWGFEVRAGEARFVDEGTLVVDEAPLRARAYVIATGSQPDVAEMAVPVDVDHLTSTTAMELTDLPESMVVVGGGSVGMEQAQLFAHLGTEVTLVGRLAPHAEPELRSVMARVFADDGITVIPDRATRAERTRDGRVTVSLLGGGRVSGHRILVATGRRPDTTSLNLAAAGVDVDDRGFIVTDRHQRTSNHRVYAAGDVAGTPQYVYVAAASGRVAAANALAAAGGGSAGNAAVDYTGLPAVVFTRPQLASAGLTEAEADAQGRPCVTRTLRLEDVPRAVVDRETRGAVKLVADASTRRLLGVHAAADGAGELMLAVTYALQAGMTVDDLADTWAPYLTMAESLRIAAGLFRSELPTSCCA